jgi:hypothetical protein
LAVITTLVGTLGTLAGVVLGFWLNSRAAQRQSYTQARREVRQAREAVYVEFLAAHRQFRRFILTSPAGVHLVDVAEGGPPTPVIDGAESQWEVLETAAARLQIVASGATAEAREAAAKVRRAMYDLARARAEAVGPGAVRREPIRAARRAEDDFARAAQADLEGLGIDHS